MLEELARKAIDAALKNDWDQALSLNLEILKEDPINIPALNRCSQAYLHKGEFKLAQSSAEKVLECDPLNSIANKCLTKIDVFEKNGLRPNGMENTYRIDRLFIEEPGKTKIVSLLNVCDQSILLTLNAGDAVMLVERRPKLVVTTHDNRYIGKLPDDVASRLMHLLSIGNEYKTYVKTVEAESVKIFIREHVRSTQLDGMLSFPTRK